jgi:cell division protein FtsI (penicillin-binding protein 3)
VPDGAKVPGVRVISTKTSDQIRKLMRLVVESGTAKQAEAPGYVVGGKTGTAEKNIGGHYEEKRLLSSFIGAFPMNDPQFVILALVDEPHGNKESHGYATAGWTVAPATSRIIQRIAPLLGVAPVDEQSPDIVRSLQIESLAGKKLEYNGVVQSRRRPGFGIPSGLPRGHAAQKSGNHRSYSRFAPGAARVFIRRA